ncbi:MAG: hypothetical protein IPM24_03305 [Bryobacterales bacterium]|nr:hypothetical protein [Bryobacterales bacterium]
MRTNAALQAVLQGRFASEFGLRPQLPPDVLPLGIPEVDALCGGLPRGALTEITGPASSGCTSLLCAALAQATADEETCALVDVTDAFDPESAAAAGVVLPRLLWIRCNGNAEKALRAADLLLQAGGFGLVAMDLADVPPGDGRRISLSSWYRFRRSVESTRTIFLVSGQEPYARQCASLALEAGPVQAEWSGRQLEGVWLPVRRRKPVGVAMEARLRWKPEIAG